MVNGSMAFPISKNGVCKAEYVRSSIKVSEIKKPETQCLCGFPDCCLASMRGFEPPTYRLGAQDVTSYTVIARDFQCRKVLENTGFFSDWPVIRYRLVKPDSC